VILYAALLCVPQSARSQGAEKPIEKLETVFRKVDSLRTEIETLSKEFRSPTATAKRREEIRERGTAIQEEFEAQWTTILDTFPKAYDASPKAELVRTKMPRMLQVFLQYHRFDDAIRFAKIVAETPADRGLARQVEGVVHFAEHRFGKAAHAFLKAREASDGVLDPRFAHFEKSAADCLELWAKELKIREAEKKADDLPRVLLKTSRGDVRLELFENEAPGAVANFVHLVEKDFYKGISFHRVIPLFMAQGGDPNTLDDEPLNDGRGGPGYTIACECGREDARMHFAGSLSMAHAGKDTGGSQFFLTVLPTTHLNGKHTVFGRVAEGLDVVRKLRPQDKIVEAKVKRKRDHEYAPTKQPKKQPEKK